MDPVGLTPKPMHSAWTRWMGPKWVHWGWEWGLPESSSEGCIQLGDRGLAGDVGHFDSASGVSGELQSSADGYTLGRGIDIAPIIAVGRGHVVNVHPVLESTKPSLPAPHPHTS